MVREEQGIYIAKHFIDASVGIDSVLAWREFIDTQVGKLFRFQE